MKSIQTKLSVLIQKMHPSFLLGVILFFAFLPEVRAQGDVLVTPRRIILDKTTKVKEINIANAGNDTATYLISFQEIRMNEDGSFEKISEPDPGQNFASGYLRIFPRKVTLAPKEAQTVKVQVINSDEMQSGEYRSHLYIRAVPTATEDNTSISQTISVNLTPVFGITIPVIIRSGDPATQVQLSNLSVIGDNAPKLNMTLNRTGNQSVFGDVTVDFISSEGKTVRVATVKGIAVYTPNAARKLSVDLDRTTGVDYTSGTLKVSYNEQQKQNPTLLAEAKVVLH